MRISPPVTPGKMEWLDLKPNSGVLESEYQRLLGYPGNYVMNDRARELADASRNWYAQHGRPWVYARQVEPLETGDGRVRIHGTQFTSEHLHDQFAAAGAHSALVVVVSAGRGCEERAHELWRESKPDEYFFMEIFGSAVVEHLITSTGARICDWAEQQGMAALPHYSPGYSGWDVSDQIRLWDLILSECKNDFPEAIEVMQTGMLRPKKSLLALFGLTRFPERLRSRSGLVPCENCSFSPCQYRRAPRRNALTQIEDVRRLQSIGEPPSRPAKMPLDRNAGYRLNSRALHKWSRERLQLKFSDDGSVEAVFRYEGTTCSNMGRPLEFHYWVKLGSADEQYRIIEAGCFPAPEDTGHIFMCEYLSNRESLMQSIATEKPLLGQPLNDVLNWDREPSPSGCYCDINRRLHKWGLVFEVIHYALTQYSIEMTNGHQRDQHDHDKTL